MLAAAAAQVHSNRGPDSIINVSRSQNHALRTAVEQQLFATLVRRNTAVLQSAVLVGILADTTTHVFDNKSFGLGPPSQ